MVRIPAEYQEVEYIESTGTQWIDTGTTINNGCVISIDFYIADTAVNRVLWGYRRDKTYQYPYHAFIGANNKKFKYIAFGIRSDNIPDVFDYDIRNSVVIDSVNKTIKVNDEIKDCYENFDNGKAFNLDGSSEYHPYLFALNAKGSELAISSDTKIYGYSVSYDGSFLQNFIPCYRKSDNEIGMYDTVTGAFFTNQGTGTFLKGNDVTYDPINLLETRRRILLNTPHIESASGSIVTFNTDLSTNLTDMKIHFTPIQEGSGDPSPDNVRPIVGWDGVTVTRTGKNIYSGEQIKSLVHSASTVNEDDNGKYIPIGTTSVIDFPSGIFKENTRYTFILKLYSDGGSSTLCYQIHYSDGSTSNISAPNGVSTVAIATSANKTVQGIHAVLRSATRRFYFEYGGIFEGVLTANDYEPYTAQSITIPFPQTIYGGYVDLVKGEVVEEWKEYVYPSKTNLFTDRGNGYYEVGFGDVNGKGYGSANNSMCSKLSYGFRITSKIGYELNYVLLGKSNRFHTLVYSDTPMTNETARQWFIDNNIQLARLVYTPTTYPLDPVAIRTLKGINNIWSDANGSIELKFWTH